MGSESEARKRFRSYSRDRSQSRDKRQQSTSRGIFEPRRSYNETRSRYDRFKTPERRKEPVRRDRLRTPSRPLTSPRCTVCRCENCTQSQKVLKENKKTLDDIKNMINKKLDVKMINSESTKAVNLCKSELPAEDMVINYTNMDQGRQHMILDTGHM